MSSQLTWIGDLLAGSKWPIALILGYPLTVVAMLEAARRLGESAPLISRLLRQSAYVLLPAGALWLILRTLAGLPEENVITRSAETAFALAALFLVLDAAYSALIALMGLDARAPKLLLEILRIGVTMVAGAVVISTIWHIDLASLIAAMGVGSIALGFAMQDFVGNLFSGLSLMSAHKFRVGDWIVVEGRPAQVVEMDWHTVTLVDAAGARIVIANSTLAKGNLVITARGNETAWAGVPLAFSVDIPPEQVRAAALEAAASVPDLTPRAAPKCQVTAIGDGRVSYLVLLPVANPSILSAPRNEFLSRFWYVAQRRGLPMEGSGQPPASEAGQRRQILEKTGAFRGDPRVLDSIAEASVFLRYRRGDVLLADNDAAGDAFLVISGALAVTVAKGEERVRLELVGAGQMLVLQEILAGAASPVQVVAEKDAEVLAIPHQTLVETARSNPWLGRDVSALTEARRQAIAALRRGIRRIA